MKISTFLEKPQMAPTIIPTVMLITAQISARDREILAPYHTASKVDWPEAPAPRIHLMLKPNFSMALPGLKCFASESNRLT